VCQADIKGSKKVLNLKKKANSRHMCIYGHNSTLFFSKEYAQKNVTIPRVEKALVNNIMHVFFITIHFKYSYIGM
jgi:hypothetical protein